MGQITQIEWTATRLPEGQYVKWNGEMLNVIPGATFNPWWGCEKVSPACKFCYAEYFSDVRYKNNHWGPGSTRREFGDKHWNEPLKWNRMAKEAGIQLKVFCGSMCDWAEDHPDVEQWRQRLFQLIEATPHLIWLLLTKRPENIMRFIPNGWKLVKQHNVWFGTTVENQQEANKRIPELWKVPAHIRFLSMEPLLGPVDISEGAIKCYSVPTRYTNDATGIEWTDPGDKFIGLDWVIVGGESGTQKGVRPTHPAWVLDLLRQCKESKTPFFFKQWGEYVPMKYVEESALPKHWDNMVGVGPSGKIAGDRELIEKGSVLMAKMGKKKSGRMIDGKEYNEMPDPKISLLSMINDKLL
jgi:protein gp37